ncbi:MAG: hypothetical protein JXO44_10945 [Clostridia bacterium]|nr:hypothetical protein [Clostridia bacterium]
MKVISLMGDQHESLLHFAERLAETFGQRDMKTGMFLDKDEPSIHEGVFHGSAVRYGNRTTIDVSESFDIPSLLSLCNCDFLIAVNLVFPEVPKVLVAPFESVSVDREEILCIIDEAVDLEKYSGIPVFTCERDFEAMISYVWLNSFEMINSKHIRLDEEFVKYTDTARENVALVKIKSRYGFELNCIRKVFSSSEGADQEAFYAGILNTTIKVYPQIIDVVKSVLYREYVEGEKLAKVVEQYSFDHGERAFYYLESILLSVVDTINFIHNELADYYNAPYTIGNTDFENFLMTEDTVYYLDLTGIRPGDCVDDFEQFAAHILSCDLIKTNDKRHLINGIVQYVNKSFFYERELKWDGIEKAFRIMTLD